MLCPNENTCSAKNAIWSRTLNPPSDGSKKLYEQIDSKTAKGDLCSFEISISPMYDNNDIQYLRIEYLNDVNLTVFKGKTLDKV